MSSKYRVSSLQLSSTPSAPRRAQNRADIIESYTEMLVDLLGQREEWMLVVDEETREIVYCNKRHQDNGQPTLSP